eukprot:365202-Chlamydomonas_euryale.AAC.14
MHGDCMRWRAGCMVHACRVSDSVASMARGDGSTHCRPSAHAPSVESRPHHTVPSLTLRRRERRQRPFARWLRVGHAHGPKLLAGRRRQRTDGGLQLCRTDPRRVHACGQLQVGTAGRQRRCDRDVRSGHVSR